MPCVCACCRYHWSAQPRHAEEVGEPDESGGELPQRRAAVARVAVGGNREVHRPDEDGAELLLEVLVEAEVEPEAAADPHEPQALVGTHRVAARDRGLDLLVEPARRVAAPLGAAVPLRDHHRGHAVDDVDRRRRRPGEEVARPPAPLLLLVRELEDPGEAALVVPASVARLELRDQLLQLGRPSGRCARCRGRPPTRGRRAPTTAPVRGGRRLSRRRRSRTPVSAAQAAAMRAWASVQRCVANTETGGGRPTACSSSSAMTEPSPMALYWSTSSGYPRSRTAARYCGARCFAEQIDAHHWLTTYGIPKARKISCGTSASATTSGLRRARARAAL